LGCDWDILLGHLTDLVGHRRCRLSKWNLLRRLGLRVALLWLGLLRPGISVLRSFLLTLLDKFLFGLLFDGITGGSRHPLTAALYLISSIAHRVFLARCVAFLLLLIFFLDN